MLLSDLKTGETGIIVKVNGSGAFRKRILEMGFIKGKTIKVILNAPLKDPIKYKIMDYEVSLRRSEAQLVEVVYPSKERNDEIVSETHSQLSFETTDQKEPGKKQAHSKKIITVALVGNPNAGKTSLFNMTVRN